MNRNRWKHWFWPGLTVAVAAALWLNSALPAAAQNLYLVAGEEQAGEAKAEPRFWIGVALKEGDVPGKAGEGRRAALIVARVYPDTPADKAGLKEGDEIVSVNGRELAGGKDLIEAVNAEKPRKLKLGIVRDGEPMTFEVTPVGRPDALARGGWQFHGTFPAPDRKALEQYLEALRNLEGQFPHGPFRFFHPPVMVMEAAPEPSLPEGVSVTITKQGGEPARVRVQRGEKSWDVTLDTLDQLPADIRGPVAELLHRPLAMRMPMRMLAPGEGPRMQFRRFDGRPDGSLEKRFEELDQQFQDLQEKFEQFRRQVPATRQPKGGSEKPPKAETKSATQTDI